jgi:hypothetical protein
MKKYIILISLALMTLACVILEGLIELPEQFIQFNGLLTILCTGAFIGWTLKVQAEDFEEE